MCSVCGKCCSVQMEVKCVEPFMVSYVLLNNCLESPSDLHVDGLQSQYQAYDCACFITTLHHTHTARAHTHTHTHACMFAHTHKHMHKQTSKNPIQL